MVERVNIDHIADDLSRAYQDGYNAGYADGKTAADVREVKRGKWIKTVGENGITSACRCNECGFEDNRYSLFNFCPNCGADMRPEPPKEGET